MDDADLVLLYQQDIRSHDTGHHKITLSGSLLVTWLRSAYSIYHYIHTMYYSCILSDWNNLFLSPELVWPRRCVDDTTLLLFLFCLKLSAMMLFVQQIARANSNVNIKVPHLWPVCGDARLYSQIQWNLSVTTTSIMKLIACDLFSNVF